MLDVVVEPRNICALSVENGYPIMPRLLADAVSFPIPRRAVRWSPVRIGSSYGTARKIVFSPERGDFSHKLEWLFADSDHDKPRVDAND